MAMFGKHEYYEEPIHNNKPIYPRYPAELNEIAEMIASGRARITVDDICDCLIDLWMYEQKFCRKTTVDNNHNKPKCRKLIF
jgi:hypothetical protein